MTNLTDVANEAQVANVANVALPSKMRQEAAEAPNCIAAQLQRNDAVVRQIANELRASPPQALLTLARGSSDHASAFFAYTAMAASGLPVTSIASSLVTLHQAPKANANTWALAWSQSGRSPDLVQALTHFSQGGSPTIAWVNHVDSPLAVAAKWAIDLHAGPERSVAATKSYLAQLSAGMHLLAHWQADAALMRALHQLPASLQKALRCDWSPCLPILTPVQQLYVLGRGNAWPLAEEAALKFKEVCGIHAEAYSSAEVMHGPMALIRHGFVVLVLAPRGAAQASALQTAKALRERGATVFVASPSPVDAQIGQHLPTHACEDERLDGLATMQSFYVMVEALARARGRDPDAPAHLSKVTLTL